ncbi:hypothetical protein BS47DRAFT_1341085 [Hydnum rufescens UP504]|uniref:Uncharacterized protein n=1 Tax=Hydnum rufescens UP504 TaxID=1448309 RepID=A0A9P6B2F0_9AGAM|nr:hypothetical protein BS47DRAFT_1341085 [Hydnum rufescens UP504]
MSFQISTIHKLSLDRASSMLCVMCIRWICTPPTSNPKDDQTKKHQILNVGLGWDRQVMQHFEEGHTGLDPLQV